ncbi:hypothetical protein BASA61_003678 [Batrachochytrium salamandrivorans]|nr:hypothetical protein BASA62_000985 [Batrachochytrium salamandrivorans]KAH6595791.1 hypothetical protein BASA61_003678 [Batrachochytrium salamandrivorans]KAH9275676.1 hypothetical protein BASA83_001975 [Batrachochytrium salamandrivorans]
MSGPLEPSPKACGSNSNSEGRSRLKSLQSALRLSSALSAIAPSELLTAKQNLVSPKWTRDLFHPHNTKDEDANSRKRSIVNDLQLAWEFSEPKVTSPVASIAKGLGHKIPPPKEMEYDPEAFDILEVSPKEIARHLTLLSSEFFRSITRAELESLAWTGSDKDKLTPAIVNITNNFNQIAIWVAQQILEAKSPKRRFQLICYFIRVAKGCLDCNNFDSVRSIVAGLQSTPVYRLERTWAMVGRRERAVFDKIAELASLDHNNDCYRRRLESTKPPFVPYLGTHLGDITFVSECMKKDKGNLQRIQQYEERVTQFHELLDEIERWRAVCIYSYPRNKCIADAITQNVIFPEQLRDTQDDHYRLSYQIEERSKSNLQSRSQSKKGDSADSVTEKGQNSLRKFDFSRKSNVGAPGAIVTVPAIIGQNQDGSDMQIHIPLTISPGTKLYPLENKDYTPVTAIGNESIWMGDNSKHEDSDPRSWTLPSKKAKRERPRLDGIFSPGPSRSDIVDTNPFLEAMEVVTTASPRVTFPDPSTPSPVSPCFQIPTPLKSSGKPISNRDRSSSYGADTGGSKGSYRQKMVNGIMKHIRKPRSESQSTSQFQDDIDVFIDPGQTSEDFIEYEPIIQRPRTIYPAKVQVSASAESNIECHAITDYEVSLSSTKSLSSTNSGHPRIFSDGGDGCTKTPGSYYKHSESFLDKPIGHSRALSEGGIFRNAQLEDNVEKYIEKPKLTAPIKIECSIPKPLGKLNIFLQGVLSKKEETTILGHRVAKREWVQVWSVLESDVLTLYRYDKSMKRPTFISSSTRRQLNSPAGSNITKPLHASFPKSEALGKSIDGLIPKDSKTSPHKSTFGHCDESVDWSTPDILGQSAPTNIKDAPNKQSWSISESFADISFTGPKVRLKREKDIPHTDEASSKTSINKPTSDLIEIITLGSKTQVENGESFSKRDNVFRLLLGNSRSILIQAGSFIEMQSWTEAICTAVKQLQEEP